MKYVFKNIRQFFTREPGIFFLLISSILISTWILHFSVGLFQDYRNRKLSEIEEFRTFHITFSQDESALLTRGRLSDCLSTLSSDFTSTVDMFLAYFSVDGYEPLQCRFLLKDGAYEICTVFQDNLFKYQKTTAYFTPEQEASGASVALMPVSTLSEPSAPKTVSLFGQTYEAIGQQIWCSSPIVPFLSLPEDAPLSPANGLTISFSQAVTKAQYQELSAALERFFGTSAKLPPMPSEDQGNVPMYNTMLLLAVLIAAASGLNFAIFYRYILLNRLPTIAVYLLLGKTKWAVVRLYLLECMTFFLPLFALGTLCFHYLLRPWICSALTYGGDIYGGVTYLWLFLIYFLLTLLFLLVQILPIVFRTSPGEIFERNGDCL